MKLIAFLVIVALFYTKLTEQVTYSGTGAKGARRSLMVNQKESITPDVIDDITNSEFYVLDSIDAVKGTGHVKVVLPLDSIDR